MEAEKKGKIEYRLLTSKQARKTIQLLIEKSFANQDPKKAVKSFFDFIERHNIDISFQPVAIYKGRICGYALLFINPGKVANVVLPQHFEGIDPILYKELAANLLSLTKAIWQYTELAFIQVQLDLPATDEELYIKAGFHPIADLIFMKADVNSQKSFSFMTDMNTEMSSNKNYEKEDWVTYSDKTHTRFINTILESYIDTLDCPEISGLRKGEDIIESHKHTGLFCPDSWFILEREGKDIAVILLNDSELEHSTYELVYMGVVPEARGRGIGKKLLLKAFELAKKKNIRYIRLAVDTRNTPAIRLYKKFGFFEKKRQRILIMANPNVRK